MSLVESTAKELLQGIESGQFNAREIVAAYLQRIQEHDPQIGAFLAVDKEGALQAAEACDLAREKGTPLGPLAGLPVATKDLICAQGVRTSCGSKILEEFRPPFSAGVSQRLVDAGAIEIGRTNMDEFAMGGSTENSAYQPTRNPWDLQRVPGGSSGGSAASVAAGMAPLAIGSDTGGSIRQPAAFCGVSGLKPTYGRVSRFGLIAYASSLDQIGPFARTAEDLALLLQAISGHDPRDSTSAAEAVPNYRAQLNQPMQGVRLGVIREHLESGVDPQVSSAILAAVDQMQDAGATVVDMQLPNSRYGVATYYIIAPCEASSNLARYDGAHYGLREQQEVQIDDGPLVSMYKDTRTAGFGTEVKRRIMLGTYALSAGYYEAYYLKALKVRRLIRDDYDAAFQEVDLLVGPTTPSPAFKIGELVDDPLSLYMQDLFTVTANLAGIPAISVPCGFNSNGLPIGLQLQAPAFQESRLLQVAHQYQQHTDWHLQRAHLS